MSPHSPTPLDGLQAWNVLDHLTSVEIVAAYLQAAADDAEATPHATDRAYLLRVITDAAMALRKLA